MGHLVQPSCRSRVTYSRLHRTLSRQVLNISREGESTTSLGNLFQCSITLKVKKFFLMFSWNFLCFRSGRWTQVTQEGYRDTVWAYRYRFREAKIHLEFSLVRVDSTDNKKSFYRCNSSKKKEKKKSIGKMQAHCWMMQGPGGKWHRKDWNTPCFLHLSLYQQDLLQESQVLRTNGKV